MIVEKIQTGTNTQLKKIVSNNVTHRILLHEQRYIFATNLPYGNIAEKLRLHAYVFNSSVNSIFAVRMM